MRTKLYIVLMAVSLTLAVGGPAWAGHHKPHKHRAISGTRNNLPPGFGSASGSSGESTADGAPAPEEPADDGDDSNSQSGDDASPRLGGSSSPTTQTTTTTAVPQVVTTLAPQAPAAVTTKTTTAPAQPKPPPICSNLPALTALPPTMDRDAATGICSPKCLNHPDFTFLPDRWYKQTDGNCYYRGEDNFGVCKGDQFVLATRSTVESLLNSGYGMGIWVDGVPPDRHMHCLVTDLATYGINPKDYVFSGKYVQDGGPQDGLFDSPTPRKEWAIPLYPYWVPKSSATAYAQRQSVTSVMAYGLLWGSRRYNNANSFAKQLRHQGGTWKSWKKNHPVQAQALTEHAHILRQLK
jgi:hypothetical protein